MTRILDRLMALCYKVPMPMPALRARSPRLRAAVLVAVLVVAALSCSSDPDGPLGSDSGVIGSTPGDVFQDTVGVYADTVIAYNAMIRADSSLTFGRSSGYTHTIILNFPFEEAEADGNRVVLSAELRLVAGDADDIVGAFPARIYRLRYPFTADSTLAMLDTLAVIPDPSTGSADRTLQFFPSSYALPNDLVQGWVRGDTARTALAIVYTDPINDRLATFKSKESSDNRPQIHIQYTDLVERRLFANQDAIFVRPVASTSNLVISDGYVRRVYFRVHLDQVQEQSAVHTARLLFHLVPGSVIGTNSTAVMYAPLSSDPASSDFKTGQLITNVAILPGDSEVTFKLTNALFLTLQGSFADNGFVLRLENENSEVRQMEFYGSAAPDSLLPRLFITSSTPADFDP